MTKKEQEVKGKPKPVVPKPQTSEQKAAPTCSSCGSKPGVKPTKG